MRRRRAILILTVVSVAITLTVIFISIWRSGDVKRENLQMGHDAITGQPVFNRRVVDQGNFQIRIWSDGAVLFPTGDLTIICDIISIEGIKPFSSITLTAVESSQRQWNSEVALTTLESERHTLKDGQVLLRYRIADPFGGQFNPAVCLPKGNEIQISIIVYLDAPKKTLMTEPMHFRAARR